MSSLFLILTLLVFFGLSAFFSLAETAIFSSNRFKIRHLAKEGNRRASELAGWLDAPENLLATILLANNFASIGAATVSAALVSRLVFDPRKLEISLGAEAVLLTLFILLFCELGPKALAARYPERISLQIVIPIAICMRILYPATRMGIKVAGLFYKHVNETKRPQADVASHAELRALINTGDREDQVKMLERVLEFSERQVKDVMVPRTEVTAIDISTPMNEVVQLVESTRYTRFPVYKGVLDNVIGILHGKDLMPHLHQPQSFRMSQLLRKPVFIPDTAKLNNSIQMLQNAQTHLGVVVDEHGGVEGIVTIEDLIEQIVGEIRDEHDVEVDSMVAHADGSILIDSSISVRELNERLSLNIPETGQYVTLAGFLLTRTGRLPREGEEIAYENNIFRIEQMIGRRIMRVRRIKVEPLPAPTSTEAS
ncbi:MAG TPA: hemolysin family protein [Terriglobia bacterium]|nr:hemolysin family protein [Terriglobia bacterium]